MFWGLIMDSGKRYTQIVERAFHVSMACLEPNTNESESVSVMLVFDNKEFILCNLQKQKAFQSQLDLNFQCGDKIAFMSTGKGRVHLTGYLLETDEDDDMDDEDSMDVSGALDEVKESGKRKKEPQNEKAQNKKAKLEAESPDEDDDDDDDDDEDFLQLDSEEEDNEEEEEEEESGDDNDEDESDVDLYSDEVEEESPKPKTPEIKKKDKQLNKTPNDQQAKSKTPNEKMKNKSPKEKTPNAKQQQQQQKSKTPGDKHLINTPNQKAQMNGISGQQQSGKKKKGETPKGGDTPKGGKSPGESPMNKYLEAGVHVEDTKVGNGPIAKPGRQVSVYYVGRLKNGKQFDATTEGSGFKFRLGRGEVIKGWDIGVTGMKVGGKRKIVCPPSVAYGNKGSPPVIPPNSTLVFEVELKAVN